MQGKIIDKLKFVGEQLQHYAPFLEATGYEVSQINITLSLGIIPGVSPIIERKGDLDISKMVAALKENKASFAKLIDNFDATVSELESLATKAESFKKQATNVVELVEMAEYSNIAGKVKEKVSNKVGAVANSVSNAAGKVTGTATEMLNHSTAQANSYVEVAAQGIRLVAKNTKQPIVKKILNMLASLNEPGKNIEIPGYGISNFNIDISLFPSLSFSLIRKH